MNRFIDNRLLGIFLTNYGKERKVSCDLFLKYYF